MRKLSKPLKYRGRTRKLSINSARDRKKEMERIRIKMKTVELKDGYKDFLCIAVFLSKNPTKYVLINGTGVILFNQQICSIS